MQTATDRIGYCDDDVSKRVESYLGSKHFPGFRELLVDVDHGIVTISGKVDSFHERQIALNSCRRVAGVLQLVDEISVESTCSTMAHAGLNKMALNSDQ